ncbi:MAG: CoxG family protein, partial [Halovenus sp.]
DEKYLEFEDTVALETTKDDLWETISDPEVLTMCVPGAESIERVSERKYTVDITRGVSKLTLSLSGEAEFVELNPPDYIVTVANAFDAKTGSDFEVLAAMEMTEPEDGAVALSYRAEVTYSGGAAGISKKILRPIVKRDVNTYFQNIKDRVESESAA